MLDERDCDSLTPEDSLTLSVGTLSPSRDSLILSHSLFQDSLKTRPTRSFESLSLRVVVFFRFRLLFECGGGQGGSLRSFQQANEQEFARVVVNVVVGDIVCPVQCTHRRKQLHSLTHPSTPSISWPRCSAARACEVPSPWSSVWHARAHARLRLRRRNTKKKKIAQKAEEKKCPLLKERG